MRILVVVSCYKPDGGAAATLFPPLREELVKRGHEVTVLNAVPHYPSGLVPDAYQGGKHRFREENGVKVVRVGLPSVDRSKLAPRLFQFIAYQVGATGAGLRRDFDVLLTHTPALEVWLPFVYFSTLRRKPVVYSVHDIFPEVGIRLGIFRSRWVVQSVGWLERYCLKRARRVRILSKSFGRELTRAPKRRKVAQSDRSNPHCLCPPGDRSGGPVGEFMGSTAIAMYAPESGDGIEVAANLSFPDLVGTLVALQAAIR